MNETHGLRFSGTRFWVTHRRREFGPFDYEWSKDLRGIELLYRGVKFGEFCNAEQLFADTGEFELPRTVVEVASIVLACTVHGLLHGTEPAERRAFLVARLTEHGYSRFADALDDRNAA